MDLKTMVVIDETAETLINRNRGIKNLFFNLNLSPGKVCASNNTAGPINEQVSITILIQNSWLAGVLPGGCKDK
jgi:hypothetical protein